MEATKKSFRQYSERTLRKFNKEIRISVSVDLIAEKLLNKFKEDEPYRVLLTEQIVGALEAKGRLSGLYNALNGDESVIDFKVGQIVEASDSIYDYLNSESGERRPIGIARIAEINPFNDAPITLDYWKVNSKGACTILQDSFNLSDISEVEKETEFEKPLVLWAMKVPPIPYVE